MHFGSPMASFLDAFREVWAVWGRFFDIILAALSFLELLRKRFSFMMGHRWHPKHQSPFPLHPLEGVEDDVVDSFEGEVGLVLKVK